jgi:hypothetical protein
MRRWRKNDREGKKIAPAPYNELIIRSMLWIRAFDPAKADDCRAVGKVSRWC